MRNFAYWIIFALLAATPGCIFARFDMKLFKDSTIPLREFTLSGEGDEKAVLIPVTGTIDNQPEASLVTTYPGVVQEVVAHLHKAGNDENVKVVILQIDSPGGSVTASDILYREVVRFKEKRPDVKVVSAMMDMAASGGYYIATASDSIVAHPTTVTGSIGVIFLRPDLSGLMEKIGARVLVTKSGAHKDMGNPFRPSTDEEDALFQAMIDQYYERFVKVVARGRDMDMDRIREIADGRIYTGEQAREIGLIDRVGYIEDAVEEARALAGLSKNSRLVVYRRTAFADDNPYNTATMEAGVDPKGLVDLGLDRYIPSFRTGFYYLWLPEL